nr:DUF6179 domain-containing protein [uncultured Sellimonas sp.]
MEYKMEELVPIVESLARKYTAGDSTSVTYETAQMLMEGVLYCLEEYRNQSVYGTVSKDLSAAEQYRIGSRLVYDKAKEIREIYNEMSSYFNDYGVGCLGDTVKKGIPEFLKWYDVKFCPQDTILTLDYPILKDIHTLRGADAVCEFLRSVRTEQRFLNRFDEKYIKTVLKLAVPGYEHMVENVCSIIWLNMIGHLILEKPFHDTGFHEEEYERLKEKVLYGDIEYKIRSLTEMLIERFYENDEEMMKYLFSDKKNIAVRIKLAAEYGQLHKIFVF